MTSERANSRTLRYQGADCSPRPGHHKSHPGWRVKSNLQAMLILMALCGMVGGTHTLKRFSLIQGNWASKFLRSEQGRDFVPQVAAAATTTTIIDFLFSVTLTYHDILASWNYITRLQQLRISSLAAAKLVLFYMGKL